MQSEPVSPELVLVDPALAQRERARLEEAARLKEYNARVALRRVLPGDPAGGDAPVEEPASAPRRVAAARRALVPAFLMGSLLVNGVLTAALVTRVDGQGAAVVVAQTVTADARTAAARTTTSATAGATPVRGARPTHATSASTRTPAQSRTRAKPRARAKPVAQNTRAVPPLARASVERKLMLIMLEPRSGKVPRRFVDPRTGLVKNNVQLACKRREKRAFLCSVRLASDAPNATNYVQFRQSRAGHETVRWLRSR